ncbi:hypothetical protein [Acinetobacter baumannii]|jgi:hypothetical protein|uniref:Phage abortive infection protein n=1 Tax=Acinetobacter baumannii TaxID=470 RepID=A0A7U4Z0U5_ACIBA|nr:hypothetical protein [Acinetobacter baumannii]ABS90268.2 hypothetical protein A1S_3843 [Acinetobacter baumannii ATCC 17978]AKQ25726.1 hypothetical protein ACX60_02965 [Acinetobacter baumannii]APP29938.1 hypothetical protein AUO97_03525 [Acinetobacter baumannii]APX48407.1 hypothetical protein AT570_03525 [Acinetobacter baumannii]MCQ8900461.1 hypothetical protein [Acinetobacter baumannii]
MENKNYHWLILFVILIAIITAWLSFPIFFEWLITKHFHINPEDYGKKFGAVGDTYGSLNTLISSIALCAVAYSTWLQVTSLKETREVNAKQLTLAKQAHDEQMIESQNAIFATKFYSLLNFKKDKLNALTIQKRVKNDENEWRLAQEPGMQAIEIIANEFIKLNRKNNKLYIGVKGDDLFDAYRAVCSELNYGSVSSLVSYFYIYEDLCQLIRKSKISDEDRKFYKSVLSSSMTQAEQILLLWICPMFKIDIEDSEIFTLIACTEVFKEFAFEFHKSSHFKSVKWKDVFSKIQTPA